MTQSKAKVNRADSKKDPYRMGYLGECQVILELAKRNIYCHKLDYVFELDLLLENGLRVEVKTSNIVSTRDKRRPNHLPRDVWTFNNPKKNGSRKIVEGKYRNCDYYVLVCFDKLKPIRYYIVPNEVVGNKWLMTVPVNRKVNSCFNIEEYKDRWDLLTKTRYGGKQQ